jgi:hypothetical protein
MDSIRGVKESTRQADRKDIEKWKQLMEQGLRSLRNGAQPTLFEYLQTQAVLRTGLQQAETLLKSLQAGSPGGQEWEQAWGKAWERARK